MYTRSSARARAERAVPEPVRLHKVLGDSKLGGWWSWGGERGPSAHTFFQAGPLDRSGGFGLSGPLLVFSRAALVWPGSRPLGVPTCCQGSHGGWPGLRFCVGPPWPAAQCWPEPGKQRPNWRMGSGRRVGTRSCPQLVPPARPARCPNHRISREGPTPGNGVLGSREVRHRFRSAGQRVCARCTVCTWRCSPRPPGR